MPGAAGISGALRWEGWGDGQMDSQSLSVPSSCGLGGILAYQHHEAKRKTDDLYSVRSDCTTDYYKSYQEVVESHHFK